MHSTIIYNMSSAFVDSIFISLQIQKKIEEALNDVTSSLSFLKDEKDYIKALPEQGMSQPEVLKKMKEYSSKGMNVSLHCGRGGSVSQL